MHVAELLRGMKTSTIVFTAALGTLCFGLIIRASAQAPVAPTAGDLLVQALKRTNSLKTVPTPEPQNLPSFVKDRNAAIALGKALFWDMDVGSDGQACASCHFHAGADNRSLNQLNPGFRNHTPGANTTAFNPPFGPNYQLTAADFPFHKLADPNTQGSAVMSDTSTVTSSQGVFNAAFTAIGTSQDIGAPSLTGFGAVFHVGTALVRNVEPRNTPTVINAVFNHRNFWDSRARNEFNGVDPIGILDPGATVLRSPTASSLVAVQLNDPNHPDLRLENASLASQADGPPLSALEMSFDGRTFPRLGKKMLSLTRALNRQVVAPDDSVLGPMTRWPQPGIGPNYGALIQAAFNPEWWRSNNIVQTGANGTLTFLPPPPPRAPLADNQFTQMQFNFSLFWGIAVQMYEATLRADDTPFDRFMEGNLTALNDQQQRGLDLFLGTGRCINCHGGPELTNASVTNVRNFEILERMIMGNDQVAVYDNGHYNIGVRPTLEDIGIGAPIGPLNLPLSNSRFFRGRVQDLVSQGLTIREANQQAGVPRILARPGEAARLLAKAAALLGNPLDVMGLLSQADALLLAVPPNPTGASAVLVQASSSLTMAAATTAAQAQVAFLTGQAASLLPDPVDPGADPLRPLGPPLRPDERVAVDGAHKVPGLRNVELTAPYFHSGGMSDLLQVVEFYNRGGNFAAANQQDLDIDIQPLFLTDQDKADLVAFLTSLTDERVRREKAPFDHPSLNIPNGGSVVPSFPFIGFSTFAVLDDRIDIPAVGAGGAPVPLGTATTPFANFLQPLK